MKRSASLRLALAVTAVLVLGVAGSSGAALAGNHPAAAGGTILGAGPFSPNTLDPDPMGIVDEQTNFMMAGLYTGTLLSMQPPSKNYNKPLNFTNNLKPDLATSVHSLKNHLGYRFTLRRGVMSNYGNELTSADVLWTFKRMVHTNAIGAILMALGNVNTKNPITVTGPFQFTLNLSKPSPVILDMLQISAMGIVDKTAVLEHAAKGDPWGYKWLADHEAGFGPYEVSQYTSASSITLVPNPHFFGAKPSVTKVIFKQVPSSVSRLQLLQGGSINLDWQTDPTEYSTLRTDSNIHVYFDHAPLFSRILPNFRAHSGPLTNPLVRRALQDAINRQAIAKAVLPGQATPGTSCVPNAITPAGFHGFSNKSPNVKEAKKLLAQAGYPHGLTISIATNYGVTIANLPDTAQFLTSELAAAGINLVVHSYPTQAAYLQATVNGHYEALMDTFQPFVGDAGFYMETTLASGSAVNYGAYSNKSFDALVSQASTMPASSAREKVLAKACTDVVHDVALIPLINIPTLTATAANVKGVYDYPDLQLHFDKMRIG